MIDDGHSIFAYMMIPEDAMGTDRIFVRNYFRIGSETGFSPERLVYSDLTGFSKYTQANGKFGITPYHSYQTSAGTNVSGFSGTGGGGNAWQARMLFNDFEGASTGPAVGSWNFGFSSFDYSGSKLPPGFTLQGDTPNDRFGDIGGRGGAMYYNQWYCMEYEFKLNSVIDPVTGEPWAPDGLTQAQGGNGIYGGFKSDGEVRFWLDGVLCYERLNAVMRVAPYWFISATYDTANPDSVNFNPATLQNPGYIPGAHIRPLRNLGMKYLIYNFYFGGQYPADQRREVFIDHVAYGSEYIGPIKFSSTPTTPAWLESAGNPLNTWVEIPNSKMSTDMVDFSIQYAQGLSTKPTVTAFDEGEVFVSDPGYPLNPP